MIPAIAQTLANILVSGTSIQSTEQIDFDHPRARHGHQPRLSLYCYDIQESLRLPQGTVSQVRPLDGANLAWFDITFLLIAWDQTALGEQRLLSEALSLLLQYSTLPKEATVPALQGYGALPLGVTGIRLADTVALWKALGIPLRPALHLTVTSPFTVQESAMPLKVALLPMS